jgi:hypothetical protein
MRRHISRAVLVLVVLFGVSTVARADIIQVGSLIYTDLGGEVPSGFFHITNQTGANTQDDFPVLDFMNFAGMTLTVNGSLFGTIGVPGDFTDSGSPAGYEFDSNTKLNAMLAAIGGAAPAGPFNVAADASQGIVAGSYLFIGDFFLIGGPMGNGQTTLPDFSVGIIAVNARRIEQVPEPVTLSLLGTGIAGLYIRRRRSARN